MHPELFPGGRVTRSSLGNVTPLGDTPLMRVSGKKWPTFLCALDHFHFLSLSLLADHKPSEHGQGDAGLFPGSERTAGQVLCEFLVVRCQNS